MTPNLFVSFGWLVWALSWMLAGIWSDAPTRTESLRAELSSRVVLAAGFLLLCVPYFAHPPAAILRWPVAGAWPWLAVGFAILGFAFMWWARLHLGRLWSPRVARKQDHRLIESGPYALVRHPIYTGLCLAALATAAVRGALTPILGAGLMILGCWMKARLEEQFLAEELGAETYRAYARRVPMLIPFIGGRR